MDVEKIMKSLGKKRPIFYSESDFQFAPASEIKSLYESHDIRLEVPFGFEPKGRIDILVRDKTIVYPIELNYLKKAFQFTADGEKFAIAEGVHDIDMYDCMGDIARYNMN